MARLALRFALAAALVAVLLGGSVAQSDDPAPTPAHLIVHKVRTARDGARAEPRASTEPAAVLIASPSASRAPVPRLDTVPGDGSIARPSSIRARSAAGRARLGVAAVGASAGRGGRGSSWWWPPGLKPVRGRTTVGVASGDERVASDASSRPTAKPASQ